MRLLDVNVLLYAFREDVPTHEAYRSWLEDVVSSDEPFGVSDLVLSGFLRIATHPKVFDPPSPLEDALAFAEALRSQPNCLPVAPSSRHWEIFARLCRETDARGNRIPDTFLAALAIDSGCEWITGARGFQRYTGLRWSSPV